MARPKKLVKEQRSARYNLRLTTAEKLAIARHAHGVGLDPAEFIRRRALHYEVPRTRLDPRLLTELNRIGNELNRVGVLLNQLARATHTGRTAAIEWRALSQLVEASRAEASLLLDRLALSEFSSPEEDDPAELDE